jgi:hypothetical protein
LAAVLLPRGLGLNLARRFGAVFAFVLVATAVLAQNAPRSYLAYVRVIDFDVSRQQGIDACIIVSDDGLYRFEDSPSPLRGGVKVYHGRLSQPQLTELKSLIEDRSLLELHSSEPHGSMMAERELQMVSLRIHRPAETQELVFIVSDGRGEMPPAAGAFIPWMGAFLKPLGKPDRRAQARRCAGLDATPDFSPQLQKR